MPVLIEDNPHLFYSTEEVAELLQINEVTVRRWIKDGTLKAKKLTTGYQISGRALFKAYNRDN